MPSQLLVLYKLYLRDVLQDARDCSYARKLDKDALLNQWMISHLFFLLLTSSLRLMCPCPGPTLTFSIRALALFSRLISFGCVQLLFAELHCFVKAV